MTPAKLRASTLALFVALLSSSIGCDQDHPVLAPPRGGVIRGLVSDGAAIDNVFAVTATAVGQETEIRIEDNVGPDGRFALHVPNGKYLVNVRPYGSNALYYHFDGPVAAQSAADTVTVAGDEQELAFACGRVALDVDLPAAFEGEQMWGRVESVGNVRLAREYSGVVGDGLHLEMRFVPPGSYRLTIQGGGCSRVYLPPTFAPESADLVEVSAGQELAYACAIDACATLAGSVTGSWQTFGSDRPRVYAQVSNQTIGSTDVAADGSFAFAFLAGAPVRLAIWIEDVDQWVGGNDFASATVFDLEAGGAIAGVDYVESGLECLLTGDLDDDGAIATVYDVELESHGSVRSVGDTLRIPNLPAGPMYLRIRPRSDASLWLPQYFDRRDSLAVADPIVIPPDGQLAHVVSTLVRGGRIRGRILDVMGLPPDRDWLEFAVHAADDSVDVIRAYYAYTASYDEVTGDFVLNQLQDGAYKLRARAKEVWTWWPHASSFAAGGTVTVENHADVEVDDWQLLH